MIEQAPSVFGHDRGAITLRVVQLLALPMPPIVEGNDAAAVFLQFGNPGRINPVDVLRRRKAVDEKDRIALAFIEIGNFNGAVVKARHHQFREVLRGNG